MGLMRLALTFLIGGVVLSAITGSAATISNTVSHLGAVSLATGLCDRNFSITRQTAYEPILGQDEVTSVTVSGIDGSACAGRTLKAVLTDANRNILGSQKTGGVAASDTSKTLDFSGDNIADLDVVSTHVVIVHP